MESFFALLQKNVLNRRSWVTREQLRIAMVIWIERTDRRGRRQSVTPIKFETIMNTTVALAASLQPVTYPRSRPDLFRAQSYLVERVALPKPPDQ